MIDSPSPFAHSLHGALVRAGWRHEPGANVWAHDGSRCHVELATGRHVWLFHRGKRLRLVGSRKQDATRAADDVAEQLCDLAAPLSYQPAGPAPY